MYSVRLLQGTDAEILNRISECDCRLQRPVILPRRPQGVVEAVRVLFEAMSVLSEVFSVFIEVVRVLVKALRLRALSMPFKC